MEAGFEVYKAEKEFPLNLRILDFSELPLNLTQSILQAIESPRHEMMETHLRTQ